MSACSNLEPTHGQYRQAELVHAARCGLTLVADVLSLYEGICSDTLRRMISFERSEEFNAWLLALKDKLGRARIIQRIRSAEHGNFGDCEPVGEGVSEMRVHIGPG